MKHPFYYIGTALVIAALGFTLKQLLLAEHNNPLFWIGAMFIAGMSLVSISSALLLNTLKLYESNTHVNPDTKN